MVEAGRQGSGVARSRCEALHRLRGPPPDQSTRGREAASRKSRARGFDRQAPTGDGEQGTRTSCASTCSAPTGSSTTTTRSGVPTRPASTRRSVPPARCSSGPGPTRSRAARRRSCATSSASASSACPASHASTATSRGRRCPAADCVRRWSIAPRCRLDRRLRARVAHRRHRSARDAVHRRRDVFDGAVRRSRARPSRDRRALGPRAQSDRTSRSR